MRVTFPIRSHPTRRWEKLINLSKFPAPPQILLDSLGIMLAIVIPTIVATLAFAWWFRASNKRSVQLPDWAYSGKIELVTWSIPLLTIMLLGGVAWISSHDLDPAKPLDSKATPIEVQVVSLDWKWLFIYPMQHVASVNQLAVPVGQPIHFSEYPALDSFRTIAKLFSLQRHFA